MDFSSLKSARKHFANISENFLIFYLQSFPISAIIQMLFTQEKNLIIYCQEVQRWLNVIFVVRALISEIT